MNGTPDGDELLAEAMESVQSALWPVLRVLIDRARREGTEVTVLRELEQASRRLIAGGPQGAAAWREVDADLAHAVDRAWCGGEVTDEDVEASFAAAVEVGDETLSSRDGVRAALETFLDRLASRRAGAGPETKDGGTS